jgi:hypothetical protein
MASAPRSKMATVRLAEDSSKDSLPQPGRYRHFKGDEYEVVNVARHSETEDWLVVYYQVDDPERLWVRPAPMFLETVKLHGCVHRRFELTERQAFTLRRLRLLGQALRDLVGGAPRGRGRNHRLRRPGFPLHTRRAGGIQLTNNASYAREAHRRLRDQHSSEHPALVSP